MTSWEDVALARASGATHIGMIFAASPRRIEIDRAKEIARKLDGTLVPVAVFVDPERIEVDGILNMFPTALLQFAGEEPAAFLADYGERAIKVIHIEPGEDLQSVRERCNRYERATVMFDTGATGLAGGSGMAFAWSLVEPIARERRVWVAGGLRSENVAQCIQVVRPFGVDVRSGIETNGRKDPQKMRAYIAAVRDSDAT